MKSAVRIKHDRAKTPFALTPSERHASRGDYSHNRIPQFKWHNLDESLCVLDGLSGNSFRAITIPPVNALFPLQFSAKDAKNAIPQAKGLRLLQISVCGLYCLAYRIAIATATGQCHANARRNNGRSQS